MSVQAFPIPLVITGNQPSAIAFAPPLQGLGTAQAVRLSNVSPYVAELTFGFGASTFGLAPGEINIWEWFSGKGSIEVNFEPGPSNITNAYFMIEVSDVGLSDFPGTYPSTVSLATVTIEGSTTLDTFVTNTASDPVPVDLTTALPAGTNVIGTVDVVPTSGSVFDVSQATGTVFETMDGAATNPANILAGFQQSTTSTPLATIVTIPAGRTWKGSVAIQTVAVTGAGGAAAFAGGGLQIRGAGSGPANGQLVGCVSQVAAEASTSLTGTTSGNNIGLSDIYVSAPTTNSVTIDANSSITGTGTVSISAWGVLL